MRPMALRFSLALALIASLANAQAAETTRIRGTIAKVDGATLSIQLADGTAASLKLTPPTRIAVATKASLADVRPGMFVGVANVGPNGLQDALEVHIFPDAMRGTNEGQTPWDLGTRSRMTNGTAGTRVESYDGQDLTLTYKGGESTIQVRPNTPVVRFERGSEADLKPGASIFVRDATRDADGPFVATSIVVGRDGTKLAM